MGDVAETSGLTKPTLYRHFSSKEVLVAAYLDERGEQLDSELRSWVQSRPPADRPGAVIDWLCDWISRPGFYGCAFVRAYAELHDDEMIHEKAKARKRALLRTILDACRSARVKDPRMLAGQLLLIVEGATSMAFVNRDAKRTADVARSLARVVLRAAGLEKAPR